jgi:hypothetical protein
MSLQGYVHIIPARDLCPHAEAGDCWCLPSPDVVEPRVLIHHAADGREVVEAQIRRLTLEARIAVRLQYRRKAD